MRIKNQNLQTLAHELLLPKELDAIKQLFKIAPFDYVALLAMDKKLGGPSMVNVSCHGHGRYQIKDRDIFRPLQYCRMHFELAADGSKAEWLTRYLVHMSSLHIESLVKRIARIDYLPLGQLLREAIVRQKIDPLSWSRITRFTRVYNDSKHNMSHPKDTHFFSIADAIVAYFVSRKLATVLYPHVKLYTDLTIFDKECPD